MKTDNASPGFAPASGSAINAKIARAARKHGFSVVAHEYFYETGWYILIRCEQTKREDKVYAWTVAEAVIEIGAMRGHWARRAEGERLFREKQNTEVSRGT